MARRPTPANGILSATGHGTLLVRITAVTFGTSIISSTGDSRRFRTLYTNAQSSHSFGIAIVCQTNAQFVQLGEWIEQYGRKLERGRAGLLRVRVPSRKFDRIGSPNGAVFGGAVGDVTRSMTIGFVGAHDLVSLSTTDVTRLSGIVAIENSRSLKKDKAIAYFYPTGTQLSGAAKGADLLYDSTAPLDSDYVKPDVFLPSGGFRGGF